MSDEELVKRLRKRQEFEFIDEYKRVEWEDEDALEAADRIEALTERLTAMGEQADKDMAFIGDYIIANGNLLAERDALEAKLAKALEGLRVIAGFAEKEWVTPSGEAPPDVQNLCDIARATLAEIEGEKTW